MAGPTVALQWNKSSTAARKFRHCNWLNAALQLPLLDTIPAYVGIKYARRILLYTIQPYIAPLFAIHSTPKLAHFFLPLISPLIKTVYKVPPGRLACPLFSPLLFPLIKTVRQSSPRSFILLFAWYHSSLVLFPIAWTFRNRCHNTCGVVVRARFLLTHIPSSC